MVTSVAFSPDGRRVLTGSADWTAKLWDALTAQELRTFAGHSASVAGVAFSPNGRRVLTGSYDKTAKLWDAVTGQELRTFPGHSEEINSVAFSPDGRHLLSGSKDGTVKLWDAETGQELRTFVGNSDEILSVAFSPDGRRVLMGSWNKTAKLWDTETGQELRTFAGHSASVSGVAFSPDGRQVLTGSYDKTAKLWDAETGREIRTFAGHSASVSGVAFSPDRRQVLTGSNDGTAKLWDAETGREIRTFAGHPQPGGVASVAISPDGRQVLTGSYDKTAKLWDVETGHELRTFAGHSSGVLSVAFSTDGRRVLTGNEDNTAKLWDAETGQGLRIFAGHAWFVESVAFSPDGRLVLTGSFDKTAKLWDAETGKELRAFAGHSAGVTSVAFSPDGQQVLTGSDDGTAKLWDTETGKELRTFDGHHSVEVTSVAFSPDGRHLLTGSKDATAKLWDTQTGKELRTFAGHFFFPDNDAFSVASAPDGRRLLTGSGDGTAKLWDADTGQELRTFEGHSDCVTSVAYSPDGQRALTGSRDKTARLWDAETGQQLRIFAGHSDAVTSVTFSPNGRRVLTGSHDGTTKLWDAQTGRELCSLTSFDDGTWSVADPDGRFDTNNLDNNLGLHWVMPDDPFYPLPLEVFMRDYYEPGLLGRIIAGEKFAPTRSLMDLNRVQPGVRIARVEPEAADAGLVDVTVEVRKAEREFQRSGKLLKVATGVYDLRLFRDGQIVGEWPKPEAPTAAAAQTGGTETIEQWRKAGAVAVDPKTGTAAITFKRIKLPRQADTRKVEFTAYTFNEDRVKSQTAAMEYEIPNALTPLKGRAYLITVGVNASETPAFDLRFAAQDARAVNDVLPGKLSKLGEYQEVVQVPLISDYQVKGAEKIPTETMATKANVKAVLDLLGARQADPARIKQIPSADKLRPARPEDLVIISFSSHGYADGKGGFYFLPYDVGKANGPGITSDLLRHAISSAELSDWLRDVDAGQMAMIVDACHSAATVEAEGFKPGPMGSRGLGQLAYDKRMRILAASQAADVAWEYDLLQHGLLTYALVHDGLEGGQADYKPKDGKVTLAEWLGFGAERVPKLDQAIREGHLKEIGVTESRDITISTTAATTFQHPVLFDFAKTTRDATIAR
jgi:WD40 repeat protein/uncharacterized caspase-like protein